MIDLPVPVRADDASAHPRLAGLGVALALAGLILAFEQATFRTSVTVSGLLIGPYLGWCLGPDAAAFRRPARTVLEMASVATLLGAILIAWHITDPAPWGTPLDLQARLGGTIAVAAMGMIIYGIPALMGTTMCAFTWYRIVHWMAAARSPRPRMELQP